MPSEARSGSYPIDSVMADEIDRLRLQDQAWAEDTARLLGRIGVSQGWRCLDLGCGPGGITPILSELVGESGEVVGLDSSEPFLRIAEENAAANTRFVLGDAYATNLPAASFDLVHMRFLASTSGEPHRLVAEAKRLLKPGGVLATQEADGWSLKCYPPHPAFTRLFDALRQVFPGGFGEDPIAHRLYRLMREAGLQDVHYDLRMVGVRAGDPWIDYLPSTSESLGGVYISQGILTEVELQETLAACRAHLAHPDTVCSSVTMVQAWGSAPI